MNRRSLLVFVLLDFLLVNLAFVAAYIARYVLELFVPVADEFFAPYSAYIPFHIVFAALMMLFLYIDGLYAERRSSWFEQSYRIVNATTTVGVIIIALTFIVLPQAYSRGMMLEAVVFTISLLSGVRLVRRLVEGQMRKRGVGVARVLIVGAAETGRAVMRNLVARPELGYRVIGFVDDDPAKTDIGRFRALGGLDNLPALLGLERIEEVIITLPWMYQRKILELVRTCDTAGVRARVVPDLFHLSINRVDFDDLGGIPLISLKEATIPRVGRWVKRAMDVVLAVLGLILAAPFMLLAALLIRLESPGPLVFRQTRIGEHGRPFDIFKFRSMRSGAEEEQERLRELNEASGPLFKMKDDPRLTHVGRMLRRLSMDELPQLWNILRGDMSLVGPRPAIPQEVEQYQAWHRQRLDAPQGLTGLWQVSGRSDLTFDEMCLLDIYYIENWSLGLDLIILLRTIPRVLLGDGAY